MFIYFNAVHVHAPGTSLIYAVHVHASDFSVEFSFSRDQTTKIADSVLHRRALSGRPTCQRS